MKIAIINNLHNNTYHERDGYYSSSMLKAALKGTEAYHKYITAEKKDPSTEMIMGTLSHTCLLEHDKFNDSFIMFDSDERPEPDKTFASKLNKEWKADLETQAVIKNIPIVEKSVIEEVIGMRETAMRYPQIAEMVEINIPEVSIFIEDFEVDGIGLFNIKVRPDILTAEGFEDYKTVRDVSADAFKRTIEDLHYDLSIALYYDVLKCIDQYKDIDLKCYWLVQDKTGSRNIMRYDATSYLEIGRLKYRKALAIINDYNNGIHYNAMDELDGFYASPLAPSKWTLQKYGV